MDFQPAALRLLRQLPNPGASRSEREPRIASQRRRAQKAAIDHLTESRDGPLPLVDTCQVAGEVEE